MKYNIDTLVTYCNENKITLINNHTNDIINRESYIEFKCIECFNQFTKNFRQLVKTGAYCQICMNKIAKNKIRESKVKYDVNMLMEFCDKNNINSIDILKTDTEGYDLEVLRGGSKMLEARKIKFVLSEVAFYPGKENTQFLPVFDFLSPYGFRFYGLYDCAYWGTNLAKGIMFSNALFVNEKLVKQQKT